MNTPALVWFRSDLRMLDNPALHRACAAGPVIGVFAPNIGQWHKHDWGNNKINYVLRQVQALSANLLTRHIPLLKLDVATFDDVPDALLQLCRKHKVQAVYFNDELEVNEQARDQAVQRLLEDHGIEVYRSHDQTVIHPNAVKTLDGNCFKVYTPFRKAWLAELERTSPLKVLPMPKAQEPCAIKAANWDAMLKEHPASQSIINLWPAGEKDAKDQLKAFVAGAVTQYKDQRDYPAIAGTSRLSAPLACGVISAKQCYAMADAKLAQSDGKAQLQIRTWLDELIWREFYRHVLVGFPRVCRNQPFKSVTRNIPWSDDRGAFEAWCNGQTGFPIVDAAMRQLNTTGWMHNRLRMITAMFLTKDLLIDWRWGERYFMNQLIDGDFASNNGGWQWAASTGTDAVPYFRIFNPTSQSRKFDLDGGFIRQFIPELADLDKAEIHDPPSLIRASRGYPMPIVDHGKARLRTLAIFKNL